ncbi:type I restriction-modification system endonuclease [Melghirimyces algeriensis]|uniref:Type I restriction enzyme, R subunit n=1 Tax=Melghirimyces algeriensis TaxID=910412 RepID=A0A521BCT4_9BACL|nr:type I restriction-modification system endonuclease [Melghirimyces algeriensis]SMO44897.1 type I restriction enzyme, R subunit [Melghirimyces algeriensis]
MGESNFQFLQQWPLLTKLGEAAERNLHPDPNTTLFKLRLFGETMAKIIYEEEKLGPPQPHTQVERLRALRREGDLPQEVMGMFHSLRKKGNPAVHDATGTYQEARTVLEVAYKLAVWFMQTYGDWTFEPQRFQEPAPIPEPEEIRRKLEAKYQQEQEKLEQKFERELERIRNESHTRNYILERRKQARAAANRVKLSEEETRRIIDSQLEQAGWEVDSRHLRFATGARPVSGKNRAIAEWPTADGSADYALFVGLQLVGLVEAKKMSEDVPSHLEQAKRYGQNIEKKGSEVILGPWGDYYVPFIFATNGRDYFKQAEEQSGIWYQDLRSRHHHPRALPAWLSPDDLKEKLEQDDEGAQSKLQDEPLDYLQLRPYQEEAILAVEQGIREGKRELLLSMATGTGKTRTAIGLLYRLIKTKTFRRILFLVDRTALGEQAEKAFQESPLENLRTFTQIFELQGLEEKKPNPETKVHIQTVQGMVQRLFKNDDEQIPSAGLYDCIIVDEAHRGYKLDKEMTETEMYFRDQQEYVSQYRRVLDYFDAVKIGLTATPAFHTQQIFGSPIYNYGYTEAVVDGFLIDHTPPHQLTTRLAKEGIRWEKGESVEVFDAERLTVETIDSLEDEVNIELDQFNNRVITESFNETVLDELAQYIDLEDGKKALIFAANDNHADMVVRILKKKLAEWQGEKDDRTVMKITGSIDKPSEAIKRFKNEAYPKVAVTVDLLTTGIDVPEICTIVFLRRVKSRILYEQMMGRATRPCERVGKEHFEIWDPVRLYEALEPVSRMKPATVNPHTSFSQLVAELREVDDTDEKKRYSNTLVAKLSRKRRFFQEQDRETFHDLCGQSVEAFTRWLRQAPPEEVGKKLENEGPLLEFLDQRTPQPRRKYISKHADELLSHERGYGNADKPEEYLKEFNRFLQENENRIPALRLVCQRPSDLTRESLKALRRELAKAGYRESKLRTAWNEMTSEEIAADIIGFIRQQMLKEALVSHEERVRGVMEKLRQSQAWKPVQKRWLGWIEKALIQYSVLGPDAQQVFNEEPFQDYGGFRQVEKVFGKGQAQALLNRINRDLFA